MMKKTHFKYFTSQLLLWDELENDRAMPWKGEKDPYKIWLSEIILQQTRVEQGMPYYEKFIAHFPTVKDLANAKENTVFKLWEGLGYYTRCKNLIATAQYISKELKGVFPDQYEDILSLKGIGPYTAAAIASFAFDLPYAVVDGNVFRVLSRFFGIHIPIDSTAGKKEFTELAQSLLDKGAAGKYNQALMDFGATVCKPQQAMCLKCNLQPRCVAFKNDEVSVLPVKEKSIVKKNRRMFYFIIQQAEFVFVRKRIAGDIWENLYEFVLFEPELSSESGDWENNGFLSKLLGKNSYEIEHVSDLYKQALTHRNIVGQFIRINITKPVKIKGYEKVLVKELKKLAFPQLIAGYLKKDFL